MKKILLVLMAVSLLAGISNADFITDLQQLASQNAENYVAPFVTGFGTNMNNGLYHTAAPHKLFGFDIGVRVMGAMVPDDAMTYTFALPPTVTYTDPNYGSLTLNTADIYPASNLETPTVFGDDQGSSIAPDEAMTESALASAYPSIPPSERAAMADSLVKYGTFPMVPGLNIDLVPLAMPQVCLGLPFKSEVLLRFMPEYDLGDYGKVSFFGVGLKHSVSQYIPMCPVDISVQGVFQQLKLGDIIESTHTNFNVHASKKISLLILSLTPYVGLGMESSNLKVDYTITGTGNPALDNTPVSFDIKGDNGFRGRVGISTRILLFKLYGDYSFLGDYPGYSAGFMISIL